MIDNKTKFLSLVLRVCGLIFLLPVALAGCSNVGAGGGLGDDASFGLANEGRAYATARRAVYDSRVERKSRVARLSKRSKVPKVKRVSKTKKVPKAKNVKFRKIQKRLPIQVARVTSKPVLSKKMVVRPLKKKLVKWVSKKPANKKPVAKPTPQMVPAQAIRAQIKPSTEQNNLSDLSKVAVRDEEATPKKGLKRTAKAAPAPITFGFGQTAHRFSGQQ
ncbi:MAG: hypothetical protein L3J67_12175 [Hyphomicrobiaceae bacterium]|nr:hypothetical protein [Hyphomicrobiaceae bacterium]